MTYSNVGGGHRRADRRRRVLPPVGTHAHASTRSCIHPGRFLMSLNCSQKRKGKKVDVLGIGDREGIFEFPTTHVEMTQTWTSICFCVFCFFLGGCGVPVSPLSSPFFVHHTIPHRLARRIPAEPRAGVSTVVRTRCVDPFAPLEIDRPKAESFGTCGRLCGCAPLVPNPRGAEQKEPYPYPYCPFSCDPASRIRASGLPAAMTHHDSSRPCTWPRSRRSTG